MSSVPEGVEDYDFMDCNLTENLYDSGKANSFLLPAGHRRGRQRKLPEHSPSFIPELKCYLFIVLKTKLSVREKEHYAYRAAPFITFHLGDLLSLSWQLCKASVAGPFHR